MGFKENFIWGTATSAYQIEGAAYTDEKGLSIWDDYCKTSGNIFDNHNGDVACDHYHKFKDDIKLMSQLGIKAYRFSVSWTRIFPDGSGKVNKKGLNFYSDLVDELLKYNITPFLTFYHWDLPAKLMSCGGWMNPDSPKWFENYAETVVRKLGDRVKNYITFNEPQCFVGLGFNFGGDGDCHAPNWKVSIGDAIRMSHNVLIAHGLTVKMIRNICEGSKVGFAQTCQANFPLTDSPENIEAARESYFTVKSGLKDWAFNSAWWSDPMVLGKYPQDGLELYEKYLPESWQENMKIICQPLDFYGQNIYNGSAIKAGVNGGFDIVGNVVGFPRTSFGWPVTPKSMYWAPKFLFERYKLPILITENGMAAHDAVSLDGKVHDPNRTDFLNRYLLELKRAADDGVDVQGYFTWSFMDNFEWSHGYKERFGMVYVDFQTQGRIPKDSAFWYKNVIEKNGENL